MVQSDSSEARVGWPILALALGFPTVLTWVYFIWLGDRSAGLQQAVYGAGKTLQFALPVVWVAFVLRRRLVFGAFRPYLVRGLLFGLLVGGAIWGLYEWWLGATEFFAKPAELVVEKVKGIGVTSPFAFACVGVGYAAVHSLLEEYYWRWFVFAELRRHLSLASAALVSGLGFAAHHVIVLAHYFGWDNPYSYVFSLGVAVGGVVWAWMYERSRSLFAPWLSHALVDAGIFIVGFQIVREHLT